MMRTLVDPITNLLQQIGDLLEQLRDEQYTQPLKVLSGATLGQHIRHILEFYLELNRSYENGILNYDQRKRDREIETRRVFAIEQLVYILDNLQQEDKPLAITADYDSEPGNSFTVMSNYNRELMYNLEHTVHHMALLRIGVDAMDKIALPVSFGVAISTLKYHQACAQ
jgi:uncharacterized damage-inducible protein DinB